MMAPTGAAVAPVAGGSHMIGTRPLLAEIELTSRCNLRCAHCYQRGRVRGPDMDTPSLVALGRSLARAGCPSVTLSGGEPTLRRDWPVVAEDLARAGIEVSMITNGLEMDERAARDAGLSRVVLSLDGGERVHDGMRGRRGSFAAVVESAERLGAAGVSVGFLTTVVAENAGELWELASVVERLGASLWQVWLGIPQDASRLWLPRRRWGELARTVREIQGRCAFLVAGDTLRHLGVKAFRCQSGRTVVGIRSDGGFGGCLALGEGGHGGGRVCGALASSVREGRRDASVLASVALAAALACSSCGPRPVVQAVETTSTQMDASEQEPIVDTCCEDEPAADLPGDDTGAPEFGECVCEGPGQEPTPCMCVSHIMCTATTGMWLCPEGTKKRILP